MNIPTVKRQVIRAYIFLFVNGLLNLTFVLATVGVLVFGLLSIFGSQQWIEPSQLVRGYALIFIAKIIWTVAYFYARKRIQKQFEAAGIGIGSSGTEQVTGIINVLNHKTEELSREKALIMEKHGNDPEKAKKELVLLLMKNGGKVEG